ncbi:hypothetical protein C2E23DRAFT_845877 [Lenzites betulinus]|nr:hypothetical protein C2E23DRAFT_845877 [Lenzites betulinus]
MINAHALPVRTRAPHKVSSRKAHPFAPAPQLIPSHPPLTTDHSAASNVSLHV